MDKKILMGALFALLSIAFFLPFVSDYFLDKASEYQPWGAAFGDDKLLLNLHVASDLLTALAYFAIPSILGYFTLKGGRGIPFMWFFPAFGLFILGCGVTHFMTAYTIWYPAYWLAGVFKYLTVVASVGTLIAIVPVVPLFLAAADEAQLSEQRRLQLEANREELGRLNEKLRMEVGERKKTQKDLEDTKKALQNVFEDLTPSKKRK